MASPPLLVIGHSDGIGREIARQLLADGYAVVGLSRSSSGLVGERFAEHRVDVSAPEFAALLVTLIDEHGFGAAIHCAAMAGSVKGQPPDLGEQARTLDVNLRSMVTALDALTRDWLARGVAGHFLGLSSLADVLAVHDAPMYCASKAGASAYLRATGRLLRPYRIAVTNVRFGFVDTKLASAPIKPLQLSAAEAARRVIRCLRTRQAQLSTPKLMSPVAQTLRAVQTIQAWLSRTRC